MAINLLDMFNETVGDQFTKYASSFLGEPEKDTGSAVNSILPAILGGLIEKGAKQSQASSIFDLIKSENIDGSVFNNLAGLLGGGKATDGILERGSTLLDFIFEDKSSVREVIVDVVTNSAGIGRGSCNSLMKLSAPFVMELVGRQVKSQAMDLTAFKELLAGQRKYLQEAVPQGYFEKLGFADLTEESDPDEEEETAEATGTSSTLMSRLGPWLLLGALAVGLLYVMRSCGGRSYDEGTSIGETSLDTTAETTGLAVSQVEDAMTTGSDGPSIAGETSRRRIVDGVAILDLPGDYELNVKAGSFIDKVYTYINEGAFDEKQKFTFDNLNFMSGSAAIDPASEPQLQSIAMLLEAFPAVHVRIFCPMEASGEAADQTLSEQRALAVKKTLNQLGIANERMDIVNPSAEDPVAEKREKAAREVDGQVHLYIISK